MVACARIAGEACHILRTDQKNESAVPIDYVGRVNRAIDWPYTTWLPRSGFVPDDQPAFEAWIGRPFAHGTEHFTIACQLPVKPA